MLLLMFTGFCSLATIWALGWVLISLVFLLVGWNLVMIFIYCSWHFKLMCMRCQSRRRAASRWKRAKSAITAVNYMRRSYAAEAKWKGAHRQGAFDQRPALLEDDYDLNRCRYLKAQKRKADLEHGGATYDQPTPRGPLKFAGASSSALAFYPARKPEDALFGGDSSRELQLRDAAMGATVREHVGRDPFRDPSQVTRKSSQSSALTLTDGVMRMGASIAPSSDLRRDLAR